jgi:hypothetical protein
MKHVNLYNSKDYVLMLQLKENEDIVVLFPKQTITTTVDKFIYAKLLLNIELTIY